MHKFTGLHITFLKEILWTNCPKMPACELGIRDNFPIFWPNPKVGKTITDKAESENYPALIGTTNIELMEKFSWHRGIYMPCEAQLPFLSWPVIGEVLSVLWTACCALNLPNNLNYSAVELTQWSLLSSTVFPLISKLARWEVISSSWRWSWECLTGVCEHCIAILTGKNSLCSCCWCITPSKNTSCVNFVGGGGVIAPIDSYFDATGSCLLGLGVWSTLLSSKIWHGFLFSFSL